MNTDQSDARKRLHEQLAAEVSAEASQQRDTSGLREYVRRVIEDGERTPNDPNSDASWESAPEALLDIVTALGGKTSRLLEFIDVIPALDLTPPPAPSEPWSVISTDRDKPTDAYVNGVPGRYWRSEGPEEKGFLFLLDPDGATRTATHITRIESVELLRPCPETHVPVERALIDEAARWAEWADDLTRFAEPVDVRDLATIVRHLASLASDESSASDGGRS